MSTKIKPWYAETAALAASFAVGDTVASTDPTFAGTAWAEPMSVVRIVNNHPLHKPIYAKTAAGDVGAFDPATLRKIA